MFVLQRMKSFAYNAGGDNPCGKKEGIAVEFSSTFFAGTT
jgi:hypothetical protein